jgi:hypothetical protein
VITSGQLFRRVVDAARRSPPAVLFRSAMKAAALSALLLQVCAAQLGPGDGPWEDATPESQGLSTEALNAAEEATNSALGGRVCYVVVKNGECQNMRQQFGLVMLPCASGLRFSEPSSQSSNSFGGCLGKIVYERYRGAGNEMRQQSGFSTTKSMCASLFGIAEEQGWASVDDLVSNRTANTLLCSADAQCKHVLTMSGTSPNLPESPRYSYDTFGTTCLNTLQVSYSQSISFAFDRTCAQELTRAVRTETCILQNIIRDNNPEGLTTGQWKDRFWAEPIGLESTTWTGAQPGCGFEASTSCRDGARMAQLWLNDGKWTGTGGTPFQLMSERYSIEGRRELFPGFGREYGYTLPLSVNDPVDPETAVFVGLNAQCFRYSPEHQAVIVSMGTGGGCGPEWTNSRAAIVSDTHPSFNSSFVSGALTATAEEKAASEAAWKAELISWYPAVAANSSILPAEHLAAFRKGLARFGLKALPEAN